MLYFQKYLSYRLKVLSVLGISLQYTTIMFKLLFRKLCKRADNFFVLSFLINSLVFSCNFINQLTFCFQVFQVQKTTIIDKVDSYTYPYAHIIVLLNFVYFKKYTVCDANKFMHSMYSTIYWMPLILFVIIIKVITTI